MALKIINLPKGAKSVLKDIIKSDGTVRNKSEAIFVLSDYLILSEEPSAVYDIAEFVAGNEAGISGKIAKRAFSIMAEDKDFSLIERRKAIMESLAECANETEELNFEGFLTFRTEKYIRLLYGAVYKAAEEVFLEREYKELTGLLRESVRETRSLVKEAHIYGCFIFDENHRKRKLETASFRSLIFWQLRYTTLTKMHPANMCFLHRPATEAARAAVL